MNKECYIVDEKKSIVSDEKGHLTERDNNPYLVDMLKVENEIELLEEECAKVENSISQTKKHINLLDTFTLDVVTIFLASSVLVGVSNPAYIGTLNSFLICAPFLGISEVLIKISKKVNEKKLNGLLSEFNVLKGNRFKLDVELGDLKALSKIKKFENEKDVRIKEFEELRDSFKDDIEKEREAAYDIGYHLNDKPKTLTLSK